MNREMNNKVEWGVLGVSDLAVKKVIPAMRRGEWSQVAAIASRDLKKAQQAAERLGIPKAYGSYEELVADPNIEAIYNPLPNHLHVPWSIKAAEAGKHVLCEKPISLTAAEGLSRHSQFCRKASSTVPLTNCSRAGTLRHATGSGANFKKGRRADLGTLEERESLACQIGPKFKLCTRSYWSTEEAH